MHGPQYNSKTVIPANWDEMYDAIAQAVALAFTCGSTRIVGSGLNLNLFGDSDYHQNVAHALNNSVQAQVHADGMRYIADEFIASLAQKLDAIATGDGKTMLDKTAIVWGHEHNIDETHYTFDLPLVVVGGFDGAIQKNKFVDFRNLDSLAIKTSPSSNFRPGILLNQVLANFLRAAGLSRSDFERTYTSSGGIVMPGYGDTYIQRGVGSHRDNYGQTAYPPNLIAQMSEPLPHFANFAA